MGELRFKSVWNGMLTTSMVLLAILVALMGWQVSRMVAADGALNTPAGMVFVGLFVAALASLVGLKLQPKMFALLGIVVCIGVVLNILLGSGLFAVESLVASVTVIFLLLGMLKLGKA